MLGGIFGKSSGVRGRTQVMVCYGYIYADIVCDSPIFDLFPHVSIFVWTCVFPFVVQDQIRQAISFAMIAWFILLQGVD